MATRYNLPLKGHFVQGENGSLGFEGIDTNGSSASVTIVDKSTSPDALAKVTAMFTSSIEASLSNLYGKKWAANKEAIVEKEARLAAFFDAEASADIMVEFAQIAGVYKNGVFIGSSAAKSVPLETGTFLTIKPIELGDAEMNIDLKVSVYPETGYGHTLTLAEAMTGSYKSDDVRLSASTNAFSTISDIQRMSEMEDDFIQYRAGEISANGEQALVGGKYGTSNGVSQTLRPYVQESFVLKHFGGREGIIDKLFEKFPDAQIELSYMRGEEEVNEPLTAGSYALVKAMDNKRDMINAYYSGIISGFENGLTDLVANISDDADLNSKARQVQSARTHIAAMSAPQSVESFLAAKKKFLTWLGSEPEAMSFVGINTTIHTFQKNRSAEPNYRQRHDDALRGMIDKIAADMAQTTRNIVLKFTTDRPLKGDHVAKVKENIDKNFTIGVDEKGRKTLAFKKNENGRTIANSTALSGLRYRMAFPEPFTGDDGKEMKRSFFSAFAIPRKPGNNYVGTRPLKSTCSSNFDLSLSSRLGIPVVAKEIQRIQAATAKASISLGEAGAATKSVESAADKSVVDTAVIEEVEEKAAPVVEAVDEERASAPAEEAPASDPIDEHIADELDLDMDDDMLASLEMDADIPDENDGLDLDTAKKVSQAEYASPKLF